MIRHVVVWKMTGNNRDEREQNARAYKNELESLAEKIPGMSQITVGFDLDNVDNNADVVLISEHESVAALATYQDHPLHVAAKQKLAGRSVERYVVDYKV